MSRRSVTKSLFHLSVLPLTIALTGVGCIGGEQGNGMLGEQELNVDGSFNRVAFAGCVEAVRVDVDVTGEASGDAPTLRVEGDSNLLDHIVARVQNGELYISCEGRFNPKLGLTVRVTTPAVDSIRSDGSGDFSLRNASATKFVIKQDGSGEMKVEGLKATTLEIQGGGSGRATIEALGLDSVSVNISGSSEITLSGDAKSMAITGSDSGSVDAHSMEAETVNAKLVESSHAIVCAKVAIEGSVIESGELKYDCSPMSVNVTIQDDGIVAPY